MISNNQSIKKKPLEVVVSSEVVDVEEVVVDVVVVEEATRFEDTLFDFDKRIK